MVQLQILVSGKLSKNLKRKNKFQSPKQMSMANFKTCINGHNYDSDQFTACPYCPANVVDTNYEKTLSDFKTTQALDDNNQYGKTMINEETADFKKTPAYGSGAGDHPFKRTQIVLDDKSSAASSLQQSEHRKIVGWLVTFSNDEYGQDFRLYAGKNKIGSAAGCDILINDPSVSAEHTTILFRDNEFLIKDNFSTNGTRVNGISVNDGKLKEGDELRLGNTIFKFKSVF
jgi:hypothetical protein